MKNVLILIFMMNLLTVFVNLEKKEKVETFGQWKKRVEERRVLARVRMGINDAGKIAANE